ncbi:hypothetical protein HDV05_008780, partial [Chytridiales sp. JEL 0842]
MPALPPHSFTWIFAVTVCFAILDAYAIGANDVANSFATSVGSRSLKLWQAVIIAIFTEFIGAVALGASTTGTIRDGIIRLDAFNTRPDLLMSAFMCALIGSSSWVMFATRLGWPVSTTHSIVGAIIGVGISAFGPGTVNWGWDKKGVAQIVTSWIVSPAVAGVIAVIIYLFTRQFVFKARDSLKAGIYAIPVYFTITAFIVSYYVVTKNGKTTLEIKAAYVGGPLQLQGNVAAAFTAIGAVTGFILLFSAGLMSPWFYRRLVKEEKLAWYHMFYIWFVPTQPHDDTLDLWLKQTLTPHVLDEVHANNPPLADTSAASSTTDIHTISDKSANNKEPTPASAPTAPHFLTATTTTTTASGPRKDPHADLIASQTQLNDLTPADLLRILKTKSVSFFQNLTKGITMDVASVQSASAANSHRAAILFDNKTEYLFSYLQVMTAAFASFAHGSNDVANAIGPLAAVYELWSKGSVGPKAEVQIWMLAMGGIAIDLGLAFYGWRVMINLGNNLTYHSPSRGFSMELGAALSVIT